MSSPKQAQLDVTVGIPTCDDDPEVLSLALDAIAAAAVMNPPVIVDMSSTDRIAQMVRSRTEEIRYFSFPESSGVAESRNRIVALADTRHLLFLDADCVPRPGWANALVEAFGADDRVALAGARILPTWPRRPPPLFATTTGLELLGMLDLGDRPRDLPRVMGSSFALDRERADPAPFRLELGRGEGRLIGWEEVQLSLDVAAAGWGIRYAPDATVDHHVRPDRLSWRWMLRRAYVAGLETHLSPSPLEPFPRPPAAGRSLKAGDQAFKLATTPAFLAGRLRGAGS